MAWRDVPELRWPSSKPWAKVATPTGELWIQSRDFLKFGQMYLDGGWWKGRQVVPKDWVRQSLQPHVWFGSFEHGEGATSRMGYGYQWWYNEFRLPYGEVTVPFASGNGGQRLWVVPQLGLAVVHFAGNYNWGLAGWHAERLLLEHIVPWAMGIETTYQHGQGKWVRVLAPGEFPVVDLTHEQRSVYVGTYDEAGKRIEVYDRDGGLHSTLADGSTVDLIPTGGHVFAVGRMQNGTPTKIYWPDERVVFVIEKGEVLQYEWRQGARTIITGTRVR
jgi:YD repeat-containing protein